MRKNWKKMNYQLKSRYLEIICFNIRRIFNKLCMWRMSFREKEFAKIRDRPKKFIKHLKKFQIKE